MSELFNSQVMPAVQKMYRYAFSILKNEDTAHDVVQDCLEKIWKKKDILDTIHQPEAWVMRITRNQCYDWVKTNRFSVGNESTDFIIDNAKSELNSNFSDEKEWLDKVLDELQPKQKEIFHLRDIEGFTYQEIAEVLNISIEDVKVTLHRARKTIREKMTKISNYGIAN